MATETKVRKIGNSLGIFLPKEALQALRAQILALPILKLSDAELTHWLAHVCLCRTESKKP